MTSFIPPVKEILFALEHAAGMHRLPQAQRGDIDMAMAQAALEEAGRLAAEVLAPLNRSGDCEGSRLEGGAVITPKGFREAYARFCEGGWNGVPFDPAYGGMGLPWTLAFALQELVQAANLSFGLCPLLTQAGVEAIHAYGTPEQKQTYLAKLVSGEWTGSMQLTEPQAGTDLGLIRCRAEPQGDGSYKLFGQKIYITYGEHDFTGNIIHMVLARIAGAPEGTKGISMFLVPKFIPDAKGNPGVRNDAYAVGIEHKLGIHASPTCTMQYGDNGGATGWLIGRENEGLKNMFIMMNNARLGVGIQGVALAERAYQHAQNYAQQRVQGTRIDAKEGARVKIAEHPDVCRMLTAMKALIAAGRALAYEAGVALDLAKAGDTVAAAKVNLLTPVVKAWCTDMANEVAGLGVQVHGGMGFIEETGAAQYVRDARILTIYEGTNGVQAQDLCMQKLRRDEGAAAMAWLDAAERENLPPRLHKALAALRSATRHMLACTVVEAAYVSVPYLGLFGTVAGGIMHARMAGAAAQEKERGGDAAFYGDVIALADFYMAHILPRSAAFHETVMSAQTEQDQAPRRA